MRGFDLCPGKSTSVAANFCRTTVRRFTAGMLMLLLILGSSEVQATCGLGVCIDARPSGSSGGGGWSGGGGGSGGGGSRESADHKHYRWAKEYEQQGNLDAAASEYRKAIANDPAWPGYRNALGNVLFAQKNYAEALEAFRSYASLKPGNSIAHNNIGLALWGLQRYGEAEAELAKAVQLDPSYTSAQSNLIQLVSSIKSDLLYNGFLKAYNETDPRKSEALYRQYLLVNPTDPAALGNLGRALQIQGRFIEAEAAYREALLYAASNSRARENIASSLNGLVGLGVNSNALKELLAAKEQGVAAASETLAEAVKARSIRCFGDSRGCVYSNDHALENIVLAPGKPQSSSTSVPQALKDDRDFSRLQQARDKQEKEYKETFDALQAAWAVKDSGKADKSTIDMLIVEQKNKLTMKRSEIRTTEIQIDKKYQDLGFTPPAH